MRSARKGTEVGIGGVTPAPGSCRELLRNTSMALTFCGICVGLEPRDRRELWSRVAAEPANDCCAFRTCCNVGFVPDPRGRGELESRARAEPVPSCCASRHPSIKFECSFSIEVARTDPGCCRELKCHTGFRAEPLPSCCASRASTGAGGQSCWSESWFCGVLLVLLSASSLPGGTEAVQVLAEATHGALPEAFGLHASRDSSRN
mmetsp:Transcript_125861/g.305773  ORF Transcript_125861/g.305773 Transcript_125861/m.305773 type:complete len:205 (-) Transcript_125861:218-832(-)